MAKCLCLKIAQNLINFVKQKQIKQPSSMKDFAAIDFETANPDRSSICSVGVVIVRDAQIVDTFYSLVQPEPNYYHFYNSMVHGLTREDTECAPVFPKVWEQVESLLLLSEEDVLKLGFPTLPHVAHNKAFDETCLKAAFCVYQMDYPDYTFYCTYQAAKRHFPDSPDYHLPTIAELCGYNLTQHHHALADAQACAWIAKEIL